jgi:hypothetical protein
MILGNLIENFKDLQMFISQIILSILVFVLIAVLVFDPYLENVDTFNQMLMLATGALIALISPSVSNKISENLKANNNEELLNKLDELINTITLTPPKEKEDD